MIIYTYYFCFAVIQLNAVLCCTFELYIYINIIYVYKASKRKRSKKNRKSSIVDLNSSSSDDGSGSDSERVSKQRRFTEDAEKARQAANGKKLYNLPGAPMETRNLDMAPLFDLLGKGLGREDAGLTGSIDKYINSSVQRQDNKTKILNTLEGVNRNYTQALQQYQILKQLNETPSKLKLVQDEMATLGEVRKSLHQEFEEEINNDEKKMAADDE